MKRIFFLCIILFLVSCNAHDSIAFQIENQADSAVYDVNFYTSEKLVSVHYDSLKPHEIVSGNLDMSKNKIDGDYILEFVKSNTKQLFKRGYYTNGNPLEKSVHFIINKDSDVGVWFH